MVGVKITIRAAYRYVGYMTRDLETAAEAAEDMLGLRMLPDDLAARLSSFRDDCEMALQVREQRLLSEHADQACLIRAGLESGHLGGYRRLDELPRCHLLSRKIQYQLVLPHAATPVPRHRRRHSHRDRHLILPSRHCLTGGSH